MAIAKPSTCANCPYYNIGKGFVHGTGTITPRFIIVAQSPGAEELTYDPPTPLVGTTGKMVNKILYDLGVKRSELYVTNIIKCQPPNDELPKAELFSQIVDYCTSHYLERELKIVHGDIIALGGLSFQHLTGKKASVWKYRGYPFPCTADNSGRTVISTIHPAAIFKSKIGSAADQPPGAVITAIRRDFEKMVRGCHEVKPHINTTPTEKEVDEYVKECLHEGVVAVDIETTGFEKDQAEVFEAANTITLIGLSCHDNEAVVVSPEHFLRLDALFNGDVRHVGHNYISDLISLLPVFGRKFPDIPFEDTMLQFHACYSDMPKGLSTVASFYTNYTYWKDWWKGKDRDYDLFKQYNGYDAASTWLCYRALCGEVRKWGVEETYLSMLALCDYAYEFYVYGLPLNVDNAMKQEMAARMEMDQLEKALQQLWPDFNIRSSKQVLELLYSRLKLPPQYTAVNRQAKKLTAGQEALQTLFELLSTKKPALAQVVLAIKQYKTLQKLAEYTGIWRYGKAIHPSLKITATATGRLESRNPNTMQMPEEIRTMFVADCD
jgi:uracil-DNA glycosylase